VQIGSRTVTFVAKNALKGSASTTITVNAVAGVDPVAAIPARPRLSPSPMRSRSTLSFYMPVAGSLEVSIHDITGRCVRRVVNSGCTRGRAAAGDRWAQRRRAALVWRVYFYSIRTSRETKTGRMVITR
jgi:hypothetical protein